MKKVELNLSLPSLFELLLKELLSKSVDKIFLINVEEEGMAKESRSTKVKIDFELTGEIALRFEEVLDTGYFSSKPEFVKYALRQFFIENDENELRRARLKLLKR
jgi:hypothetical protein